MARKLHGASAFRGYELRLLTSEHAKECEITILSYFSAFFCGQEPACLVKIEYPKESFDNLGSKVHGQHRMARSQNWHPLGPVMKLRVMQDFKYWNTWR